MQDSNYRPEDQTESSAGGAGDDLRSHEAQIEAEEAGNFADHPGTHAAAGRADTVLEDVMQASGTHSVMQMSEEEKEEEISAILAEVEAERKSEVRQRTTGVETGDSQAVEEPAQTVQKPKKQPAKKTAPKRTRAAADANKSAGKQSGKKRKRKKKKKYTFTDVLKNFLPWRGDSVLEGLRKIVFFAALCVVGVCTFLISNYYLGLYHDRKAYEELQRQLAESRANRGFKGTTLEYDPERGEYIEYFDLNELGALKKTNPDLVGYIRIDGTIVDYPVVQKRSSDPNENTNDYYLHRNFAQEHSTSGCIFLDFRCNFDWVVDHKRVIDNSQNLIVYGHNMNDRSMFGSLRDYTKSANYYKEHPIVELQSLYKTYQYKIFSVFIVDGEDFTSPYAFDCWNTLDFADEKAFYEYVNNAKKRNMISNDVDVTYGDPILTLYTCNTMIPTAKLILMCRMVREDEKDNILAGTENAEMNDNVLYPEAYYKNHEMTFDIDKFVPYGPKENE